MVITLFIGRKVQHRQTFKNTTTTKRMAIFLKDGLKFSQKLTYSHKLVLLITIKLFKEAFQIAILLPQLQD